MGRAARERSGGTSGTCVKCGQAISRGSTFLYGVTRGERYHLQCCLRVDEQVDLISTFVHDNPGVSICYECLGSHLGLFPATIELAAWQLLKSRRHWITTAACSGCLLTKPVLGAAPLDGVEGSPQNIHRVINRRKFFPRT
jgi:hypothetical protein